MKNERKSRSAAHHDLALHFDLALHSGTRDLSLRENLHRVEACVSDERASGSSVSRVSIASPIIFGRDRDRSREPPLVFVGLRLSRLVSTASLSQNSLRKYPNRRTLGKTAVRAPTPPPHQHNAACWNVREIRAGKKGEKKKKRTRGALAEDSQRLEVARRERLQRAAVFFLVFFPSLFFLRFFLFSLLGNATTRA